LYDECGLVLHHLEYMHDTQNNNRDHQYRYYYHLMSHNCYMLHAE